MLLLLGLMLLAATGAFAGLLIAYNPAGPDHTVVMFGNTLGTLTSLQVFLAGIALALVFCLGLFMAVRGSTRMRRHRAVRLAERREAQAVLARRDAYAQGAGDAARQPGQSAPASSGPRRRHHRHIFGH